MRRSLTFLLGLTTMLAFGPMAPAQADTTKVVYGLGYQQPDDESLALVGRSCSNPLQLASNDPPIRLRINYTDDPEALGQRVHGFQLGQDDAVGPWAATETPKTSTFSMRVKPEDGTTSGLVIASYAAPGDTSGTWLGTAPITATGTEWRTITGTDALLSWHRFDNATGMWSPAGNATVATFADGHDGDGSGGGGVAFLGFAFGCDGNRFSYDGLKVGPLGEVTTHDFEGVRTATLIDTSASTITAGRRVTLGGAPDETVSRFTGVELTLEARPFGEPEFAPVGTAVSTSNETLVWAELAKRPLVSTEYRWVLPDSSTTEGSVSPVALVKVRTAVTSAIADSTLSKGQKLVVKGQTTPRKARVATTLQRKRDGRWRTLDTGRTRSDGSYGFAYPATSTGTWRVRVLVAASSGNLAGTSPERTATIR